MATFGEYLVQSGTVSSEHMLQALVMQHDKLMTVPMAVKELRIWSDEEQIRVFATSQDNRESYVDAAKRLGLWSQDVDQKIANLAAERRASLGEILLSQGWVGQADLIQAFDNFVADTDVTNVAVDSQMDVTSGATEPNGTVTLEGAADAAPGGDVGLYTKHLTETKMAELSTKLLDCLGGEGVEGIVETLRRDLQILLDGAKSVGAERSANLVVGLDRCLAAYESTLSDPQNALLLNESLEILWAIGAPLADTGTEDSAFSSDDFHNRYEAVMQELRDMLMDPAS